jgi:divalent metal cation (Fe/Co/Zn/Cd) transporter
MKRRFGTDLRWLADHLSQTEQATRGYEFGVTKMALGFTLTALFVLVVGALIFIGMRQRMVLEVPPRPWPEPQPLPRWTQRLRAIGFIGILAAPGIYFLGHALGLPEGLLLAVIAIIFGFHIVVLLIRAVLAFRVAARANRKWRETQEEAGER